MFGGCSEARVFPCGAAEWGSSFPAAVSLCVYGAVYAPDISSL